MRTTSSPYGVTVEGELGVLAGVEDHVFSATSTYTNPMQAVDFFKKTGCDALAISYGTCHGPNKGKDTRIRREIAIATKECMLHEGIDGFLVSHGSSTVPQEFVAAINALGGQLENAFGIEVAQLADVAKCGISKINVDTDIRLACTRNILQLFADEPELRGCEALAQLYRDLKSNPKNFDPRNYCGSIFDTIVTGNVPNAQVGKNRAAAGAVRQLPHPPVCGAGHLRADGRAVQERGHLTHASGCIPEL